MVVPHSEVGGAKEEKADSLLRMTTSATLGNTAGVAPGDCHSEREESAFRLAEGAIAYGAYEFILA